MSARRILVVDDEAMVRLSLRDMLSLSGYEVAGEAADGSEAVQQARQLRPDVVLMDISMPVKDGVQAAAEITAANPVPIVFLTAYADPESVGRAGDAGAYAFLVKPCRQADLSPAIETAVARFGERQRCGRGAEDARWALETVRRLCLEIATNPDLDGVVGLALRCVTSALKAPGAALLLTEGGRLRIRAHLGLDPSYAARFQVALGESVFGEAVAESRALSAVGLEAADRRGPGDETLHPFGRCGGVLAVPLRSLGVREGIPALGCLAAYRAEAEPFSQAEVSAVSALAGELVVGFQVAQVQQALAWRRWLRGPGDAGVPAE